MVVGGVERIGSAQHVAARCYEVAVGELHGVRIADAEGELVQPFAVADVLEIGEAVRRLVVGEFPDVGHQPVRKVPCGREAQHAGAVTGGEDQRQRGARRERVVFVRDRLRLGLSRRIDHLIAAVGAGCFQFDAQPVVTQAALDDRPFGVVPRIGEVALGRREEVLRDERHAQLHVDVVFVDDLEGVDGHGHPAVHLEQVQRPRVAARAVACGRRDGVGRRETHRVEIRHGPFAARRIDDVARQARRPHGV